MSTPRILLLAFVCAACSGSLAAAQTPAMTAGWQDGFVVQSADGANRLVIGATVQVDGRFSLADPSPVADTFLLRKARPTLSGRVGKYFDFKLMPDFGNGTSTLADAYVDMRFSPKLRIRTGKDKTPVGYEQLLGDSYLLFLDRMLPSSLVPNRDVGLQVQGDVAGGRAGYAAGLFNGVPDGVSSTTEVDANANKAVAARFFARPFASLGATHALSGLGFHLGGSTARDAGLLPSFKTPGGQTYFSYAADAMADGRHTRVVPAVFYYFKALGAFAEYVRSSQTLSRDGAFVEAANHAWGVTGSLVVTGEPTSDRGVRPRRNFDPANHAWGALQLTVRYSRLTVDPDVFAADLAAAAASPDAASLGIGANWYAAPVVKYSVTFERTTFGSSGAGRRPAERVLLFRAQLAF